MPVVIPPALVAICAALLALLIMWGVAVLVKALAALVPKGLPIIGDSLHDLFAAMAAAAMAAVQWVMADLIRPVISFILAPVFRFIDFLRALGLFAHTMAESWNWLLNELFRAFSKAKDWATHEAKAAEAWAARHVQALAHDLRAAIERARTYAAHLVAAAETAAHLALHAVKAEVYGSIHAAEHDLGAAIDHGAAVAAAALHGVKVQVYDSIHAVAATAAAADADLTKLVTSTAATTLNAAEHFTTVTVDKIAGGLAVDIPGVVAPVWDGLLDDVHGLEGVLGADFPDITTLLGTLAPTSALTASLAIAGSATMARVATRYLEECGVPNCRNLSGIGQALQDLFGLMGDAAFLAALVELIADPAGAAADAQAVLSPIVDPLVSAGRELLGV